MCLWYDTRLTINSFGKSKTHKMSTKCDKMSNNDALNIFEETKNNWEETEKLPTTDANV